MRRLETIFIVLSFAFYAWFLWHFGTSEVLGYVMLAGWGLAITVPLDTLILGANTAGWRFAILRRPRTLRFPQLFAARIAGEAVDYITPAAQIGGSLISASMVRHRLSMGAALASVTVASLTQAVGQIFFIALALALTIHLLPVASGYFWPVTAGFAIAIALTWAFYLVQVRQPFSRLMRAAQRLDLAHLGGDGAQRSAAQADSILIEFYSHHRGRLALSCASYFAAWCVGPIEIYILLHLLNQPVTIGTAILIEAMGLILERVTFLIPAKLATREGGKALIVTLLGYPPEIGFVVGLLRHVKELIWVLIGLGCLVYHRAVVERRIGVELPDAGESAEGARASAAQR